MHGLIHHGFQSDTIGHLTGLADAKDSYRHFRVHLYVEPSLAFLYPLVVDFRRGNAVALRSIFSFLLYGDQPSGGQGASNLSVLQILI